MTDTSTTSRAGRLIEISGIVQGVGFRPWVFHLAHRDGICGSVHNDARGVTIEAFGALEALENFCDHLKRETPAPALVRELRWRPIPDLGRKGDFAIVNSQPSPDLMLSIPPDLATCDECRRELFDPADRRFHYPFLNCTHCGPRYTVALGVPYDRPATTMAQFELCEDCRREYENPHDRRFHAQPIACPVCGPQLFLLDAAGRRVEGEPIATAIAALEAGQILAVKGLGGFHLACDATSELAVEMLRQRKHRPDKPFAVMVENLAAAHRLALLTAQEEQLLLGISRPIVLCRRRPTAQLASGIAPRLPLVGVFLPYTPLHHLLLRAFGRPLVMTSANLADEPLAWTNEQAIERLGRPLDLPSESVESPTGDTTIVDLFLAHDRPIARPCDDSVQRVIAGAPVVLRRGRGEVPQPLVLARPVSEPILACGAELKNAFCLAIGDLAYLGPHIGDLSQLETFEAYERSIADFERLLRVEPKVFAHDLHPEYASTLYATRREGRHVPVQHHHAHLLAACAEHQLQGQVYGLIFDGSGLGTDGAAWGGEILLGDASGFRRLATFRPLALAGGDLAVREIWRLALALLDDAFEGEPPLHRLPLFHRWPARTLRTVRRMINRQVMAPLAHGVGRYFDAIGALLFDQSEVSYEGHVATELGELADLHERRIAPFRLDRRDGTWEIDLRPMVRDLVGGLIDGERVATLAAIFHNTLSAAAATALHELEAIHGDFPVVLSGGCFANPLLTSRLVAELEPQQSLYRHRVVPPGDGGIAMGQILAADAALRAAAGPTEGSSPCA